MYVFLKLHHYKLAHILPISSTCLKLHMYCDMISKGQKRYMLPDNLNIAVVFLTVLENC
jgi:hypothetical protein